MLKDIYFSVLGKQTVLHPIVCDEEGHFSVQELEKLNGNYPDFHWFVIFPQSTILYPHFLETLKDAIQKRPEAGVFFGDDVVVRNDGTWNLSLKSEWDQTQFFAQDYIGLPLFVRCSTTMRLGPFNQKKGSAIFYDMLLRTDAAGIVICRIPVVMAKHHAQLFRACAEDCAMAITTSSKIPLDLSEILPGLQKETLRLSRRFSELPEVTLLIPPTEFATQQDENIILNDLLNSIAQTTYSPNKLHILIGIRDGESIDIASNTWPFSLDYVSLLEPQQQHYPLTSYLNQLWRKAVTEHLIVMDRDIGISSKEWMQSLLTFAEQRDVAMVGARLKATAGQIAHAGVAGGLYDWCGYAWLGQDATSSSYQNWASVHREWSMVGGGIFATRMSVLKEINGFDECFNRLLSQLDLCLKSKMAGYRIVYTPHASFICNRELPHIMESWPPLELNRFLQRWEYVLRNDPSFHPKLAKDCSDLTPQDCQDEWWQKA